MLELLSETVGKQKFNQALIQMTSAYQQSEITWENFTTEINKAHGSNLDWFFSQWFERTGVPEWKTEWKQQQNELLLTITQKGNSYRFPLDLLITYQNGEKVWEKVTISQQLSHIKIPVKGKVSSVKTDPGFKIIHWDEELKPEALAMGKLTAVQKLRIEQKYEAAEKLALSYLDSLSMTDPYGVESALLYVLGRMKGAQKKSPEALDYYMRSIKCASRNPEYLAYAYYRIAEIAVQKKDRELFTWAADQAIKADALNQEKDHIRAMVSRLSF
ncbi:hypothetical protein D3C87_1391740 [compost metagenome]